MLVIMISRNLDTNPSNLCDISYLKILAYIPKKIYIRMSNIETYGPRSIIEG